MAYMENQPLDSVSRGQNSARAIRRQQAAGYAANRHSRFASSPPYGLEET
jgi:hypothetical protein